MFTRLFTLIAASAFAVALLPTDARSQCVSPSGDMISWWTLDTNGNDLLGNNHGTVAGTPLFLAGQVGNAMTLDSNDDAITIPHDASLDVGPTGFTAEFWMRGIHNQPQSLYLVVDKSHGWVDSTGWVFQGNSTSGQLSFAIGAGGVGASNFPLVSSGTDVLDGTFHHICGTWSDGQIEMFVDGVSSGTEPLAAPVNNTRPVNIGFSWNSGAPLRFFRGEVDELSIYSRALSPAEILAIANAGPAGKCQPPASCTFRNGSGINATGFTCTTNPVIGTTWVSDIPTNAATALTLLAVAEFAGQVPLLGGEVLIGGAVALLTGSGVHTVPIPNVLSLVGAQFSTQGARLDIVGGQLSLVLLNAQDLLLGF